MNNYYEYQRKELQSIDNFYVPSNTAKKIIDYNLQSYINTDYYKQNRTKAKINVYIRKSN